MAYEADLNRLGYPSHIARDPHRRFLPDEGLDYSIAALETYERETRKAKNEPPPGFLLFVRDMGPKPLTDGATPLAPEPGVPVA